MKWRNEGGLVKLSARLSKISQTFCGRACECSYILQELIKLSSVAGMNGQEWLRLTTIASGVDKSPLGAREQQD